jgi:very-short-patch-repair endonuclease
MSDTGTSGETLPSPQSPKFPATTGSSSRLAAAVELRIAASIDHWKRKLLDLSKRNRALNFKMSKVSTIAIVDEQPAEVFLQLCLKNQGMRFKPTPERELRSTAVPEDNDLSNTFAEGDLVRGVKEPPEAPATPIDDEDGEAPSIDFVPYDTETLDTRHTDDVLQTLSTPEQLDKSLRRIDEQARAIIDEQGVNALFLALGILHYKESADSDELFKAPLVLVPAELTRKSARAGYVLKATDDDPLVNPALSEYLQRGFGIALPELPDSSTIPDDYDVQSFFTAVVDVIATQKGWAVKTDIYLGLFSFQKFVIYKDLEANTQALVGHRLIRQLITRSGTQLGGLPSEVQSMDLDQDYPPEATFQVVDADSSQLRALAAVSRNYDLVLHGPPGTGKSQTITNLIAQALAAGKSVLFVAEKMAALQVVHSRLVSAGLGEFCLELHSSKANKRAVMQELATSLDASLQQFAVPTLSTQRLAYVRAGLTEYANAVHTPYGALAISPYRAYGELGAVLHAPKLKYSGAVETITHVQLDESVRALNDLIVAVAAVGDPRVHPWRDTSRTFYSEDNLDTIHALVDNLGRCLADIRQQRQAVEASFNLPAIRTFPDVATAAAVAAVLSRSPGAPLAVLESEAWNVPPPEATGLVERGRAIERLKERACQHFTVEALEQDHVSDIAYIEHKSQGFLSFLAFIDGRYRAIKRRWKAYRLPSYQATLVEQAEEMKKIDQLQREQQALAAQDVVARQLFGGLWQGEQSSWDVLENYIRWVVEFRGICIRHGLSGRAIEAASHPAPDVSAVHALEDAVSSARPVLAALRTALGWPDDYLADAPIETMAERVASLAENLALGPRWASFESARQVAATGPAAEMLLSAMNGEVAFSDLAPAFLRAFYQKWLSEVVQARPPLRAFHTLTHEQRVAEFQALDERVLLENRAGLVSTLRDMVQHRLQASDASAALPFLRREMARQRNLSPLRRTMRNAQPAIRAIKPCFMMSPLSVAQLLDGTAPSFDLVIFDEASQLPAEDAVGAIIRGKQLVVVGDPKQLPPTNFFTVMSGQVTAPLGEDGTPLFEDTESILEEFMGAGVPQSRLKWHYRSTHESLITFSNVSFYDADLYTFPSVEIGLEENGLQFEYVEDGVYEGKGLNMVEARRVADAVVRHAKTHPELSLGLGTFNLRQQLAIQDELEQRRRQDPSLEPFFARKEEGAFFVKNLENIQGDERDVIFISVTYAKGPDGRLRYNFGPLNGENGWRRLNVLTTRARKRMRVFSSMKGEEISAAGTTSAGAKLLREFLLYAEHGRLESIMASAAADTESPFEREVFTELTHHGLTVVPQVGCAGYRIDFGILDDVIPGRFLCGIECDGVAYHASETTRDRDRLRQQVLEARGWTIHRVWSTDWFKDRQGQIDRLISLIEQSRVRAREAAAAEHEAQLRVAAEAASAAEAAASLAYRPSSAPGTVYERPTMLPYRFTEGEGRFAGTELLGAPTSQLLQAIAAVVETEAPIHMSDLAARVAGMWRLRVGTRIMARISEICRAAERDGLLVYRDGFVLRSDGVCMVRSRAGTRIPAERIAPEEYDEAVLMVLQGGYGFARSELINEVRAVFGFSRTGAQLEVAISSAIDHLLARGIVGEGSAGIRLRC